MIVLKSKWKTLFVCIAVPLAAGGLSGFLAGNTGEVYAALVKPPLSPPGWLFPVVWTILYILMGTAAWLVLESGNSRRSIRTALGIYSAQLIVNFFWPVFFFRFGLYLFSFFWLLLLLLLIGLTILLFCYHARTAAGLLLPYGAWVIFAGYLNLGVSLLN